MLTLHVVYLHHKQGEGEKARGETSNVKAAEISCRLQNWIVDEDIEEEESVEGEVGEEEDKL